MEPIQDLRTPEEIGREMLDRAQRPDGAITMEEAAHIHRAIGWPPPRLDSDGAIRAPTTDELARWCSTDPALVDAMEWPEVVEEIEHRAPAVGAALRASARETVRALRDRDLPRDDEVLDQDDVTNDDAPVTSQEIAAWTRIGCALAADPRTFRHVVGVLSRLEIAATGEETRELAHDPEEGVIVELRFHGSALSPLTLATTRRTFTIGSGDCDLVVPPELARGVAPVHAVVERVETGIRVREHGSGHGLYRSPRSPRADELLLHAGAVGWVGSCPLLALDQQLAALRPHLAWSMGLDAHATVDDSITAVADGAPLALVGPGNLDRAALARAIHGSGSGHNRTFLVSDGESVPPIGAGDGTIVVDLDRVRRVPAAFVASMFAPNCAARMIFLANTDRVVRHHLDVYAARLRALDLVPLSRRGAEVSRLLQIVWRDEMGSDRSVGTLDPRALAGMAAYRWPRNLDELRAHAPRLLAYGAHPSLRSAARSLGVRHQTLAGHLNRIGFPIRDQADRDA